MSSSEGPEPHNVALWYCAIYSGLYWSNLVDVLTSVCGQQLTFHIELEGLKINTSSFLIVGKIKVALSNRMGYITESFWKLYLLK